MSSLLLSMLASAAIAPAQVSVQQGSAEEVAVESRDRERRIVGYFIEWGVYVRDFHPLDIPGDKVTHVNYAFANVGPDLKIAIGDYYAAVDKYYPGDTWDQPYRGAYNQLNNVLKPMFPHLRTFISVGGWTWSGLFSDVALTPASRQAFAASCVDFIRDYNFDGVDIDWEYPVCCGLPSNKYRPEDKANYTLLMAELRAQLDAAAAQDGREYLLTFAAAAGYDKILNYEVAEIAQHVDWLNVMTYDFRGAWDLGLTAHHSPLYANPADPGSAEIAQKYNTAWAMQAWAAPGVPRAKICIGLPFYGRAWGGVPAVGGGLFQPATHVPPGTWDDWSSGDTGVNDFWEIEGFEVSGSYTKHWDAAAGAPYLYGSSIEGGHFISYDDAASVGQKLDYVKAEGFGGVMFWEFSGDRNHTLIDVIDAALP